MERRVVAAVEEFARDLEVYLIDETFLDLAGPEAFRVFRRLLLARWSQHDEDDEQVFT
jgi:nucleotidyltransferase/DNA polymerase involved in DNA repair